MRLTAKKYAQLLYELTDGKKKEEVEKNISSFAQFILRKKASRWKTKIMRHFNNYWLIKNNIVEIFVFSADGLEDSFKNKIKNSVKKLKNASDVILYERIDPSLLGGVKIQVNDLLIDGSLKNIFDKLRNQLIK